MGRLERYARWAPNGGNAMLALAVTAQVPTMYTDFAPDTDVDALHEALFAGAIARFGRLPEMSAIVAFTRSFLEERLAPVEPARIHEMDGDLAERCATLKRDYANNGEVKKFWKNLFGAVGLDPQMAMRDRLTLRFQPPKPATADRPWSRSTSTVGFHRDTWGTNLYAQVNWWAPVYPITAGRTFAFLPELFAQPLRNDSSDFDIVAIMERNKGRGQPVGRGEMVPQLQEDIDLTEALPVTINPGEVIVFSSQHAHVGVPNSTELTRISLETRTLRLADVEAGHGAPNVDGRARWVSYGMFRRIADGKPLPEILGVSPFVLFGAESAAKSNQAETA
jgi:hypothetical protein